MRHSGVCAVAALALLLGGCGSPQLPFAESFTTAIPNALLATDLGIVEASADNGLSGLAVYLDVVVVFDRASVTSAGEDLGFDAEGDGTDYFEADWDAVTDFVRSTDD